MQEIKITLSQAIKLYKTKKSFICFNTENNKLTNYVLTDDLPRFKNKYDSFRVISCIKSNINTITI